jgi:hypothetical protein
MKLIICRKCQDIFKLDYKPRTCKCGQSKGKYLQDGINAQYSGPAVPIGFANSSLANAVNNQPEDGMGKEFIAFVIPKHCETMKRSV